MNPTPLHPVATTQAGELPKLPKWIDDLKGSDPRTDELIVEIEAWRDIAIKERAAIEMQASHSAAADAVPVPDYSEMSREALERHAARMAQALSDDKARKFYDKYATGPIMPPSCLCCGHLPYKVAIHHAELPGIILCEDCVKNSTPTAPAATTPAASEIVRPCALRGTGKCPCPTACQQDMEARNPTSEPVAASDGSFPWGVDLPDVFGNVSRALERHDQAYLAEMYRAEVDKLAAQVAANKPAVYWEGEVMTTNRMIEVVKEWASKAWDDGFAACDKPAAVAAIKTLEMARYSYHGAELWEPPLGKPAEHDNIIGEMQAEAAQAKLEDFVKASKPAAASGEADTFSLCMLVAEAAHRNASGSKAMPSDRLREIVSGIVGPPTLKKEVAPAAERSLEEVVAYALAAYRQKIDVSKIFACVPSDANGYASRFVADAIRFHAPQHQVQAGGDFGYMPQILSDGEWLDTHIEYAKHMFAKGVPVRVIATDLDGNELFQVPASPDSAAKPVDLAPLHEAITVLLNHVIDDFREMNPSNYNHDEACDLNNWGVEATGLAQNVRDLLASQPVPAKREGCKHENTRRIHTGDGTPVDHCPDCGDNRVAGYAPEVAVLPAKEVAGLTIDQKSALMLNASQVVANIETATGKELSHAEINALTFDFIIAALKEKTA